ncbi:PREDICTED: sulfotransferase 1C2-like [Nicrophorus vespilloides]|uniref:Sulfotransferase 1C2-like n=1 Tax=Nicrophorus vespilloides TaxID=110193 RepID=A0ABM1MJ08_NICVS|nr:PREDICTED: sulfotransferase 1C2-like [Nicrophorus vespilloides]
MSDVRFKKEALTGPHADALDKAFGAKNSFWKFTPGNLLMPSFFEDIAGQILDASVREDDVWLISYPRTGSTWTQEMVWLIGNELDFEQARKTIQQLRAPMIELSTYFAEYTNFIAGYGNSVEIVENWPTPRFIKTHLPVEFLPTQMHKVKPKIIYVARHPKDLCVSYYHHCQLMHHMDIGFEEFAELFINDTVPLGAVFDHYLGYWAMRDDPNVLFIMYEDLKKDTGAGIRRIAEFMEKSLSDDEVDKLEDFLSVENMRKNPGCNMAPILDSLMGENYLEKTGKSFIRKGKVGDWKTHMSPDLSRRFDEWIRRKTEGTGLSFD